MDWKEPQNLAEALDHWANKTPVEEVIATAKEADRIMHELNYPDRGGSRLIACDPATADALPSAEWERPEEIHDWSEVCGGEAA